MELANIEKLLEKYLDARTTLQEEKELRKYFTSNDVAPHLQEYGILFGYFKESKNETFAKAIELKPKQTKKWNLKWASAVASVVLLFSVFIGKQEYDKYQQRKQFEQIKEALHMVSSQLNRGNDALYAVSNTLSKGNKAIQEINTFPNTINTASKILNNK